MAFSRAFNRRASNLPSSPPSVEKNEKSSLPAALAANPHNPSSAAYLAYPVRHVFSSLYRRMAEPPDQPVSKLLDAPSVSHPSGLYTPPDRNASPFQPPPLTPLRMQHGKTPEDELLLSSSLAEEIRLLIPPRLQLVDTWRLAYSLEHDGSSLATLYEHCANISIRTQSAAYVIVIQDGSTSGSLFGAYLSDPPQPTPHYYGTGECFLWRASILPSLSKISLVTARNGTSAARSPPPSEDLLELAGLPPPPSADTTHAQRTTTVRAERRLSSPRSSRSNSKPTSPISPSFSRPSLAKELPLPSLLEPDSNSIDMPSQPKPAHQSRHHSTHLPSPPPAATPTDLIRFKAFPYSGVNDFMIFCQPSFLSVGGGDGHYGLWLDDQLDEGQSERCDTFGNEGLSEEGNLEGTMKGQGRGRGRFEVMGVEIWYVGSAAAGRRGDEGDSGDDDDDDNDR